MGTTVKRAAALHNMVGQLPMVLCMIAAGIAFSFLSVCCPADDATPTQGVEQGEVVKTWETPPYAVELVKRLEAESLEESFQNIEYVDDYYMPGYMGPSFEPIADVLVILSNRRIGKLYAGLKDLSADEQYDYLSRHFQRLQQLYLSILSNYLRAAPMIPIEECDLTRIGENQPGATRTIKGTRYGMQMIALLTGLLGNERMWEVVKEGFKHPQHGQPLDEGLYTEHSMFCVRDEPVFPESIRGETLFLMARTVDDTTAERIGIDKGAVEAAVGEKSVRELNIYDYRTEATGFDLSAGIDTRYPPYKVEFVMNNDLLTLAELLDKSQDD